MAQLPVSPVWDLIDYTFRASDSEVYDTGARFIGDPVQSIEGLSVIPYPGNVFIEDGYASFIAKTSDSNAAIKEVSSLVVAAEINGGIPENFTIEFDIFLSEDLPKQASNVENRIFVGALNIQGYSAGFVFSREGIHVANSPNDPHPVALGGSSSIMFNDDGSPVDGLFIRAVVSGEEGRLYVYAESSEKAYFTEKNITDAELIASRAASLSVSSLGDAVIVHGSALSAAMQLELELNAPGEDTAIGQDVAFSIGSLRLSGNKRFPQDRPEAVVVANSQIVVGQAMVLNGSQSSDKMARPLDFFWEIDLAPEASNAKMQGAKHSECVVTIPAPDPLDPPIEVAKLVFTKASLKDNDYSLIIEVGPPSGSLTTDIDFINKEIRVNLESDFAGNSNTTVADFLAAFADTLAAGYNMKVSGGEDLTTGTVYPKILKALFTEGTSASGYEMLQPNVFQFSGGVGSDLRSPIFIPDTPGTYIISLMVHNGIRQSRKDIQVVTATISEQLLGHRPNSNYIFKYLPDFWNLVSDKKQLPSIWSAMTQAVSSELLVAWQNDYGKALKDISRRYQRRWLHHDCVVEIPPDIPVDLIYHKVSEYGTQPDILSVNPVAFGTHTKTAYIHSPELVQPLEAGRALIFSDVSGPEALDITELLYIDDPTGWRVSSKLTSFPVYALVAERTGGYFVADPEAVAITTPVVSSVMYEPTYPFTNINQETDRIRLLLKDETTVTGGITAFNPGGKKNTVRIDISAEDVDGIPRQWEHLREVQYQSVWQGPYLSIFQTFYFSDTMKFGMGDFARIALVDPYTSGEINVHLPIYAFDNNDLFVQWAPLIGSLNAAASLNGDEKVWSEEDLPDLSWKLSALVKHNETFKKDDLVSVPILGETTMSPQGLKERFDFDIEDNRVKFKSLLSGSLDIAPTTIIIGDQPKLCWSATLKPDFSYHPAYTDLVNAEAITNTELAQEMGLTTIVLDDGPAGTYSLLGISEDGTKLLLDGEESDHKVTGIKNVSFHAPVNSAMVPGVDTYWAEISYFDNSATVEGNFGLFVGFPEELVKSYDEDLDYLSVIKAMWFAFLSGPHFDNLKLGVQALFSLPYSEVRGQITFIDPPTDSEPGRIVMVDGENRTYNYTYPENAELAINPDTGRTIKAFNLVDDEDALNDEEAAVLADAKVAPHTKLVDVVMIEDYISNPDLIERQFGGNVRKYVDDNGVVHEIDEPPTIVEKYHKFIVDVPLEVARTTEVFPLVKTFLKEAKPAYTDFILLGSLRLSDEVSVLEETILKPTLLLKDTPHTEPYWALYDGLGTTYSEMVPTIDPNTGVQAIHPDTGEPMWHSEDKQQEIIPAERELLTWPVERTKEKVAGIDNSAAEDMNALVFTPPEGYQFAYTDDGMGNQILPVTLRFEPSHQIGTIVSVGPNTWSYGPIGELVVEQSPSSASPAWKSLGFYIPGDPTFHKLDISVAGTAYVPVVGNPIGATLEFDLGTPFPVNANTLNALDLTFYLLTDEAANLPVPTVTYWDDEDVKEKFESGYCEGVLDDYSGDGSWNYKRKTLDMVNGLNSDLDVVNSRVWVPIIKDTTDNELEFVPDEEIDIRYQGAPVTDIIWNDAPPTLLHYGASHHPKIPFGVSSPQNNHPYTYMLLGFESVYGLEKPQLTGEELNSSPDSLMNYGHESRLDVLKAVYDYVTTIAGDVNDITLVGAVSGAVARMDALENGDPVVDRGNPEHAPYFLLETMWQTDKLISYGPKAFADIITTKYIPLGGISVTDFQNAALNLHPEGGFVLETSMFYDDFSKGMDSWITNVNAPGEIRYQFGHPNQTPYVFSLGDTMTTPTRLLELDRDFEVTKGLIVQYKWAHGDFEDNVAGGLDMDKPDNANESLKLYYSHNGGAWVLADDHVASIATQGDAMGWQLKNVVIEPGGVVSGDTLRIKWEQDDYDQTVDNWAFADVRVSDLVDPVNPDSVHYPNWGETPVDHTSTIIEEPLSRSNVSEVQQHPYNQLRSPKEQFIPSFSPGYYSWQKPLSDWNDGANIDLDGGGIIVPATPAPLLTWDYTDVGRVSDAPTELDSFTQNPSTRALQNVHIGYKVRCWKEHHYTHGFTEFFIPTPSLKLVEPSSSAYDIRLGGFYFCNDDPTRTTVPTADPNSFDGTIGGSWLFLRHSETGDETAVTDWVFEVGTHPGKHIVPKGPLNDGTSTWVEGRDPDPLEPFDPGQRSDGHIYELNIPVLPRDGYYDIIIRNYRPWSMQPGAPIQIHMDEVVAYRAYYHESDGWGGVAWGTGPWGGAES